MSNKEIVTAEYCIC